MNDFPAPRRILLELLLSLSLNPLVLKNHITKNNLALSHIFYDLLHINSLLKAAEH